MYPVPHENENLGKSLTDDFDFRPSIILDNIRNILRNHRMKSSQSLLVLNLGLHYSISLSFVTYQKLIDDVIVMLLDRHKSLGSKAQVIWKTTTSLRKEKEKPPRNSTTWRLLTEQVRDRIFFHLSFSTYFSTLLSYFLRFYKKICVLLYSQEKRHLKID